MLPVTVRLFGLDVYHSANELAEAMQALVASASASTGLPSALSLFWAMPATDVLHFMPKSECSALKSRNTAGTRSAQPLSVVSQPPDAGAQTKPSSIVQSGAQPSPAVALPSSHSSSMISPSPHSDVQAP